jgi:hypothetical protein
MTPPKKPFMIPFTGMACADLMTSSIDWTVFLYVPWIVRFLLRSAIQREDDDQGDDAVSLDPDVHACLSIHELRAPGKSASVFLEDEVRAGTEGERSECFFRLGLQAMLLVCSR